MCKSNSDWENAIASYKENYWHNNPEEAEAIVWRFINAGKIIQPRLGDSLGALEGHIPMMEGGVVNLTSGARWIDPETFELVTLD